MDCFTLIYWTSPFPILGLAGELFHFYSISNRYSSVPVSKQWRPWRTVCLCPKKWDAMLIWAASCQNQQCGCAPSEDSDQPRHPPSLIRVFAVRMKKVWVLSSHSAHSEDSDQTGQMPRLIWVFGGRTVSFLVLSRGGSYRLKWRPNFLFQLFRNPAVPSPLQCSGLWGWINEGPGSKNRDWSSSRHLRSHTE